MEVLRLTVYLSLLPGRTFLLFHLRERRSRNHRFSSPEQDALSAVRSPSTPPLLR
ncbi:MAG: hypothetical protein ACLFS4_02480 [Opitutales bacterium]